MLYVCTLGTNGTIGYLMINTSTEPIQSTVNMIRAQMMQISLAMLVLGFGISIFLSQLISTPSALASFACAAVRRHSATPFSAASGP